MLILKLNLQLHILWMLSIPQPNCILKGTIYEFFLNHYTLLSFLLVLNISDILIQQLFICIQTLYLYYTFTHSVIIN